MTHFPHVNFRSYSHIYSYSRIPNFLTRICSGIRELGDNNLSENLETERYFFGVVECLLFFRGHLVTSEREKSLRWGNIKCLRVSYQIVSLDRACHVLPILLRGYTGPSLPGKFPTCHSPKRKTSTEPIFLKISLTQKCLIKFYQLIPTCHPRVLRSRKWVTRIKNDEFSSLGSW